MKIIPKSHVFVLTTVGLLVFLVIALLIPMTAPALGVFSNVPSTWPRLVVPFCAMPFFIGLSLPLFGPHRRLLFWAPELTLAVVAMFAILDSLTRNHFLAQNLIFYGLLLVTYPLFAYAGLRFRESPYAFGPRKN